MRAEHLECLGLFEHKVTISDTVEQSLLIRQQLLLFYAWKRSELSMEFKRTTLSSGVKQRS